LHFGIFRPHYTQNKNCLNEYVDIFVHTLYYVYDHILKFYVRFCVVVVEVSTHFMWKNGPF